MNERLKDGATLREHLESVWRQSGEKPDELNVPDCPDFLAYLWGWFVDLSGARQYTDQGQPLPLSYTEIMAWRDLMEVDASPSEIKTLKQLDILSLNTKKS